MSSAATTTLEIGLSNRQLFSSLFGYFALAASVIDLAPQIFLNWRRKRADGLSFYMLVLWLGGDLTSLGGVLVSGLLSTQLFLACWYTISTTAIILQFWYYSRLARTTKNDVPAHSLSRHLPCWLSILLHGGMIVAAIGAASVVWRVTVYPTRNTVVRVVGQNGVVAGISAAGLALGWISASLYAAARVPQIVKNHRSKSCEGLSPLIFGIIISGNVFYTISILLESSSKVYLFSNLPWIAGSAGTILLDVAILFQFLMYPSAPPPVSAPPTPTTTRPGSLDDDTEKKFDREEAVEQSPHSLAYSV